jgi:hypothetical protein
LKELNINLLVQMKRKHNMLMGSALYRDANSQENSRLVSIRTASEYICTGAANGDFIKLPGMREIN